MSTSLSNDQVQELTDALIACDSMQHPQKRNGIVEQLPREIRTTIDRRDSAKGDVLAIVRRCAQFPPYGVPKLIDIVRFHDKDTCGFKEVERLWSVFQADTTDNRPEKSVSDAKEVHSGEESARPADVDIPEQAGAGSPGRIGNGQPEAKAINDNVHPATWEKVTAVSFGVIFLLLMIVIAIFIPEPTPYQVIVFRITMSLAAAGVGAVIPGLIQLEVDQKYMPLVRAGGAIALFVLVYLFNPPEV